MHLYGMPARLEVPSVHLQNWGRQGHGRRGPQEPHWVPTRERVPELGEAASAWFAPVNGRLQDPQLQHLQRCMGRVMVYHGSVSESAPYSMLTATVSSIAVGAVRHCAFQTFFIKRWYTIK